MELPLPGSAVRARVFNSKNGSFQIELETSIPKAGSSEQRKAERVNLQETDISSNEIFRASLLSVGRLPEAQSLHRKVKFRLLKARLPRTGKARTARPRNSLTGLRRAARLPNRESGIPSRKREFSPRLESPLPEARLLSPRIEPPISESVPPRPRAGAEGEVQKSGLPGDSPPTGFGAHRSRHSDESGSALPRLRGRPPRRSSLRRVRTPNSRKRDFTKRKARAPLPIASLPNRRSGTQFPSAESRANELPERSVSSNEIFHAGPPPAGRLPKAQGLRCKVKIQFPRAARSGTPRLRANFPTMPPRPRAGAGLPIPDAENLQRTTDLPSRRPGTP